MPREPLTGREAVPAIYAKFEDGVFVNNDPAIIDMMLKHSGYEVDYIKADDDTTGFDSVRKPLEPTHSITELEYGHPGKAINPSKVPVTNPDMMKELQEMSAKFALEVINKREEQIRKEEREKVMKELHINDIGEVPENSAELSSKTSEIKKDDDLGKVETIDPDKEPVFEKKELKSEAAILNQGME